MISIDDFKNHTNGRETNIRRDVHEGEIKLYRFLMG